MSFAVNVMKEVYMMEDYNWVDMMEKMQEIRLFSSLHIRGKSKGATSSQELECRARIVL